DAMHQAVRMWRGEQVLDGFGAMNPAAIVERGGLLKFTGGQGPVYPNFQFWDYTKRMLDRVINAAPGQKPTPPVRLVGQLRDAIDAAAPASYQEARAAWGGSASFKNAIEDGKNLFDRKLTSEEFASELAGMSEAEREGTRIGVISEARRLMGSNPAKWPDFTSILRSPEMRQKMAALMPTPEAAQTWERALNYEVRSSEIF